MKAKTYSRLGAALGLLVSFGFTHTAEAQTASPIVFSERVTDHRNHQSCSQIMVMDADGSNLQQLTSANDNSSSPAWSSERDYIAYERGYVIYVMQADGGGEFAVTPGYGSGLDWSPNNQHLVFVGPGEGASTGLYIVDIDPATQQVETPILIREASAIGDPSWSSDGYHIAFAAVEPGQQQNIRVLDLVTGTEIAFGGPYGNGATPSFSPDGTRIAFSSVKCYATTKGKNTTTNCYNEIFIANPDGSGRTRVTDLSGVNLHPTWSPDAQELVFRHLDANGASSLYKLTLATGALTVLRSGEVGRSNWAP